MQEQKLRPDQWEVKGMKISSVDAVFRPELVVKLG
jgi:hypothetical protein